MSAQGTPIRVYNKDFVEANLAFLRDDQGDIQPFAILGAENKEVEQEIKKLNDQLGSKESDTGLRAAFSKKQSKTNYLAAASTPDLLAVTNTALAAKPKTRARKKPPNSDGS